MARGSCHAPTGLGTGGWSHSLPTRQSLHIAHVQGSMISLSSRLEPNQRSKISQRNSQPQNPHTQHVYKCATVSEAKRMKRMTKTESIGARGWQAEGRRHALQPLQVMGNIRHKQFDHIESRKRARCHVPRGQGANEKTSDSSCNLQRTNPHAGQPKQPHGTIPFNDSILQPPWVFTYVSITIYEGLWSA
jgi:hypothetical protein